MAHLYTFKAIDLKSVAHSIKCMMIYMLFTGVLPNVSYGFDCLILNESLMDGIYTNNIYAIHNKALSYPFELLI